MSYGMRRGQRVKLSQLGLRYLSRTPSQRPSPVKWDDRLGIIYTLSVDRTFCQVRWDGNKAPGDRMPTRFIESV